MVEEVWNDGWLTWSDEGKNVILKIGNLRFEGKLEIEDVECNDDDVTEEILWVVVH